MTSLRSEYDPAINDLMRRKASDLLPLERDLADLAGVRPEIERSVVDLPAPLEPMIVTTSPSSTLSDIASERFDRAVVRVDVFDLEKGHELVPGLASITR